MCERERAWEERQRGDIFVRSWSDNEGSRDGWCAEVVRERIAFFRLLEGVV